MSKTVVVLGAGATRGAAYRQRRHPGAPRPALDGDFFDRLLHVSDGVEAHAELARDVSAIARELSVTNSFPTLEQVFTLVEAAADQMSGKGLLIRRNPPNVVMTQLKNAIALQLGSCLWDTGVSPGNNAHYQCEHHQWLVDQLDVDDTIISFNYDCLIDWSLKSKATAEKWNPKTGYGFECSNTDVWTSGDKESDSKTSVKLLKLHGSLNWNVVANSKQVSLRQNPYSIETNQPHNIIPPVWDKRTKDWPYSDIWNRAKAAIYEAHAIVFVGYSMPTTDVATQVLFRAARQEKGQGNLVESLTIVNPDRSAGDRIVKVMRDAISDLTRIPRVESWAEFRELASTVWHQ